MPARTRLTPAQRTALENAREDDGKVFGTDATIGALMVQQFVRDPFYVYGKRGRKAWAFITPLGREAVAGGSAD